MYLTLITLGSPRVSAMLSIKLDCASIDRLVILLSGSAGRTMLTKITAGETLGVDEAVGVTDGDAPRDINGVVELVPVGETDGERVGVRRADIDATDTVEVGDFEGVDEGDEPSGWLLQVIFKPLEQPDTPIIMGTPTPLHAELLNTVSIAPVDVQATIPKFVVFSAVHTPTV